MGSIIYENKYRALLYGVQTSPIDFSFLCIANRGETHQWGGACRVGFVNFCCFVCNGLFVVDGTIKLLKAYLNGVQPLERNTEVR